VKNVTFKILFLLRQSIFYDLSVCKANVRTAIHISAFPLLKVYQTLPFLTHLLPLLWVFTTANYNWLTSQIIDCGFQISSLCKCQCLVTNVSISFASFFAGKQSLALWIEGHRQVASPVCGRGCDPRVIRKTVYVWATGIEIETESETDSPNQVSSNDLRHRAAGNYIPCCLCYKLIKWKIIVCSQSGNKQRSSETPMPTNEAEF